MIATQGVLCHVVNIHNQKQVDKGREHVTHTNSKIQTWQTDIQTWQTDDSFSDTPKMDYINIAIYNSERL